jgi:hypothetical protein
MKPIPRFVAVILAALSLHAPLQAGISYPDPAGGWSYIYKADAGQDVFGDTASFDALDGTWSHNNGSDQWDGSAPGGTFEAGVNAPGGAKVYQEGGVSYLRIQDPGDPRDYSFADPGNRKVYFGHDISADGAADAALDQGVTISFRARIPTPAKTTNPLDPLYRDGQGAAGPKPYPAEGDGYVTSDGGKGNFVIKQQTGGAFAFSLAVAGDQGQGDPNSPKAGFTGLTMNEFAGNAISGNVNFGQGTGTNVLALDPTDWHEFWIVLRKDAANIGTHEALIYVDGSTEAKFFKITAGNGDDYSGIGYLAMGSTATPQNSALDVDFYAFKTEAVFPPGALANLPPEARDITPARGTRYASAAAGLSFTATTQPPNSIPTTGATLILNGTDVSADLVAGSDVRNRTFTYSKLEANKAYGGSLILADQAGRKSTNSIAFDTLVESQVIKADLTDYASDVPLAIPAGRYQLYLFAGSPGARFVRVDQVAGGTQALGTFRIPNTGTVDTPQLVALTDALGQPLVLTATGGSTTFRLTPVEASGSVPRELIAVPTTTTATGPYIAVLTPNPGASGILPDSPVAAELVKGPGSIDAGSLKLFLDGSEVTGQSTTATTANGQSITYRPTAFLSAGEPHSARVAYAAGGTPVEAPWSFTAASVPALKTSWATPVSSISGKARGFKGRIHMPRADADGALFPNNPERAADQLANKIIDPDTGAPFENVAAGGNGDGSFVETETINYEQAGLEEGIGADRLFPNTDGGDPNYIALEVITYLHLPRGAHRLAVACDDGFVVWSGPSAAATTNQFGVRNPGGSTAEVAFDVLAEQEGVYAFRLVFFEGNGGADVEWYSINPATNTRTLVNAAGGLAAYQTRTGDGTDEVVPATVAIARDGTNVKVTFQGILQSAASPTGTWSDVAGATSPLTVAPSDSARFYRARR